MSDNDVYTEKLITEINGVQYLVEYYFKPCEPDTPAHAVYYDLNKEEQLVLGERAALYYACALSYKLDNETA